MTHASNVSGPPRRIAAISNLGRPTWVFMWPDWDITFDAVPDDELASFWRVRETSPGHGGAGQTAGSKGSETSHAGEDSTHVESVTHTGAPGDRGTAIDPYERILLPNGGVRFRRRRPPAPEPPDVPPSTWLPPDASPPEPEDAAMVERVRAWLFGGGGT